MNFLAMAQNLPGFWWGLLDGIATPGSLIFGIFTKTDFYISRNSGWLYNFGFFLGIYVLFKFASSIKEICRDYREDKENELKNKLSSKPRQAIHPAISGEPNFSCEEVVEFENAKIVMKVHDCSPIGRTQKDKAE